MRPHETHLWVQEGEQEEGGQSTGHGRAAKEQGGGEEEERLAEEKWPELGSPDISGPVKVVYTYHDSSDLYI